MRFTTGAPAHAAIRAQFADLEPNLPLGCRSCDRAARATAQALWKWIA